MLRENDGRSEAASLPPGGRVVNFLKFRNAATALGPTPGSPFRHEVWVAVVIVAVNAGFSLAAPDQAKTAPSVSSSGLKGRLRLKDSIPLADPIKVALISTDPHGAVRVGLILTESNRLLAPSDSRKYREVFHPANQSNKTFAMPDAQGRSLGVSDDGPGGGFYLFDSAGRKRARISQLNGYKYVYSELRGPLIISRPSGGWPGWPSIWKEDGSRNENMSNGWPAGHAVDAIRFSADGKRVAVLSSKVPSSAQSVISVYSSTGVLAWRTSDPPETAEIVYSKSGRLLAAASSSRLAIYNAEGRAISDLSLRTPSEQHIQFSDDDKRVALASGDTVRLIDVSSKTVQWAWTPKDLQDSGLLPAGDAHFSRVVCSADGRTVVASGFVWTWEPDTTSQGEKTRKMTVHTEFFALLRDGHFIDAVKLPSGTLLQDLGASNSGVTKSIGLSADGGTVVVPSSRAIYSYALSR